ncbi:hypothetical protein DB35_10790 [Streptomyces abyssalis]|uniref:Helix-turn-helix domain-containing protein n=1 Tax=Streptomyces abyssalis TaxID=933944 RepID=A0A1E7JHS4_9ACTN|nr:helix-turn-helix domain-containing protein [Streptomyces abyssalis]OEU86013.1 hypothetical protein AN215_27110 [Streptomyces abyssalis]OEU92521.1 hypothetical protein DB35_10790 [Streptomyces abyssalis]
MKQVLLPDVMTADELAAYLRMSVETVQRWARYGYGPPHVRCGRSLRWRREDVETWISSGGDQAA